MHHSQCSYITNKRPTSITVHQHLPPPITVLLHHTSTHIIQHITLIVCAISQITHRRTSRLAQHQHAHLTPVTHHTTRGQRRTHRITIQKCTLPATPTTQRATRLKHRTSHLAHYATRNTQPTTRAAPHISHSAQYIPYYQQPVGPQSTSTTTIHRQSPYVARANPSYIRHHPPTFTRGPTCTKHHQSQYVLQEISYMAHHSTPRATPHTHRTSSHRATHRASQITRQT